MLNKRYSTETDTLLSVPEAKYMESDAAFSRLDTQLNELENEIIVLKNMLEEISWYERYIEDALTDSTTDNF